jgi:2-isopropylmalate synthase
VSSRTIDIFDTTLRDGEQSPGIALQPDEKVEIAEQLDRLGVDVVEAGFAASSPGDFEGVRAVARAATNATVASLCRTRREDIDAGTEALAGARRSRLHVFIATSPVHMERKLCLEPDEVVEQARWAVAYASDRADEVEFSCEDATRSDPSFLARVCSAAIRSGATIVNLPDTVGYALPEEYGRLLRLVRHLCPALDGVTLSVHCHDDLGLAVANSLAGVAAGAGQVECTVNGIGERAGNAALEAGLVEQFTGYAVPRNKAIVGANAFAHEAGIHQDGLLKDTATYQIMDPGELGLAMTLPLGKHSGRHAFARACQDAGVCLEADELATAFARFKELADTGNAVSIEDVVGAVGAR